jgi:hypothetical protein
MLSAGREVTYGLGVDTEGNAVRIRLSRKPKKLWLAYPAKNPSPLAVRFMERRLGSSARAAVEVNCPIRRAWPPPALSHAPQRGEMTTPPPWVPTTTGLAKAG